MQGLNADSCGTVAAFVQETDKTSIECKYISILMLLIYCTHFIQNRTNSSLATGASKDLDLNLQGALLNYYQTHHSDLNVTARYADQLAIMPETNFPSRQVVFHSHVVHRSRRLKPSIFMSYALDSII